MQPFVWSVERDGTWDNLKDLKRPEKAMEMLKGLDATIMVSAELSELCVVPEVRERIARGKVALAASPSEPLHCTKRVGLLVDVAQEYHDKMGDIPDGWPSVQDVRDAFGAKAAWGGGAQAALGRLKEHYPREHTFIKRPFTWFEAEKARDRCGLWILPPELAEKLPLEAQVDTPSVKVNPRSDNGYPVLGTMNDPIAFELCLRLAHTVRQRLSGGDAEGKFRVLEATRPDLTYLRGKAKYDCYSASKVSSAQLRFYNVVPRPCLLVMQQATQVVEAASKDLRSEGVTTFIGVPLAGGGADAVVERLQAQLTESSFGYVHCGDDSWVVSELEIDGKAHLYSFTLDCTAFDLTQHNHTTLVVHKKIQEVIASVDEVSAGLWHALMRERTVTVASALAMRFRHGGPSGMPMQSKVNDMLMSCFLERLRAPIWDIKTEEDLRVLVEQLADEVGFKIRLESLVDHGVGKDLREALAEKPVLFVGYYFYTVRDPLNYGRWSVRVYADYPRMLAQLPYNTAQGWRVGHDHQVTAALKLAGVALAAGVPPTHQAPAFNALLLRARGALTAVRTLVTGEMAAEVVTGHVFAGLSKIVDIKTVDGLINALTLEKVHTIWLGKAYAIVELPGSPQPTGQFGSWADEVEDERRAMRVRAFGEQFERERERAAARVARREVLSLAARQASGPASSSNAGRPPPQLARLLAPVPRGPRVPRIRKIKLPQPRQRRKSAPHLALQSASESDDDYDPWEWE